MKIKILMILSLATVIFFAGCKSDTNMNTMNANAMNANAVVKPTESAKTDPMMDNKIQDALKAKGFMDVTVDTSTTPATLRGTYPKDKLAEVMQIANETGKRKVNNQLTLKQLKKKEKNKKWQ